MRQHQAGRFTGMVGMAMLTLLSLAGPAAAQGDIDQPPEKGGFTYSLGMPPVYKGFAGFEVQSFRSKSDFTELAVFLNLGVYRDLGSPVVGIAALSLEGYGGYRGSGIDGGARASYMIPNGYVGIGADWNATDGDIVGLFRFDFPIKRGGVFGRGTTLAFRWLPAREQTFSLGINGPLWGRNLGATRPKRDNVKLDDREPDRLEEGDVGLEETLRKELDNLRERIRWVARLSQPFADHSGADPHKAMQPHIETLQAHIDSTDAAFPEGHSLPAEIQAYHASLEHAFSIAFGGQAAMIGETTSVGNEVSAKARAILLDDIIFPYNRLLGQRKTNDSLLGLAAIAQTEFGSWILTQAARDGELDEDHVRLVWFVFQTLCDAMEDMRKELRDRWEDSRFVWLPLHYGLKPEEHDTRHELDAIIARAVGKQFQPENQVWYVINEEFQYQMQRSVRQAEDYHVLWIHDFRGKTPAGKPDRVAFGHTLNYIRTLTERVKAYDETGKIPVYTILLDQHYFEINKGRLWLRVLSKPLDEKISLPGDFKEWETELHEAQDELRAAVDASLLMSLGRSQYGEKWLKSLVKVHVNITNPADPSFRSWHSIGILPIPDAMMRDHRKIFFYDVTEKDPYKGAALFTGMGIGEHYTGPNWEDRAIMIKGPGALAVKTAARNLLLAQGFETHEIPYFLRAFERPPSYAEAIANMHADLPDWVQDRGTVMQLHNETGFHDKPINVSKAVLYSLMPSGSVLKVADSLWQSYIYASLLSGSAMRGCRVLVIAPTLNSAPSNASVTMARAHGLMGRLIVFSNAMDPETERHGGLLKVGLYAPKQGVGDIAGRFQQAVRVDVPWEDRLYRNNEEVERIAENAPAMLDSLGYSPQYIAGEEEEVKPKLHLKANFFASKSAWEDLGDQPGLWRILRLHLEYLAAQGTMGDDLDRTLELGAYPEKLANAWIELVKAMVEDLSPAERDKHMFYLTVGSTNMDYRSMVMDGEVQTLISGWQALYGLVDFLMLPGLCEWMETTEQLDLLLPPPGGMTRSMAGLMRLSL